MGKRQDQNWDVKRGKRIRRAREMCGLSQQQLAELAGCSQSAISIIEKGRSFDMSLLYKLAEALDVDEKYIVVGDGY